MDDYHSTESTEQLYESFVRSLSEGADLSSYSKDDLLDIYDYSRGVPDDYISGEVLSCGARFYPRSKELAERKVMLYYDLNLEDMAAKVAERLSESSVVRRFMMLKKSKGTQIEFHKIESLLSGVQPGTMDDVHVLFVVDVLSDMGLINFVERNPEFWSALCQYPTTVYAELYRYCYERYMYTDAAKYCRKLTEMDPFVIEYWVSLSNLFSSNLMDPEQGLEAAEFALAIDPDSEDALLAKANALLYSNEEEASRILDTVLERNAVNSSAVLLESFLLFKNGKVDDARNLIGRYASATTPDRELIELLLVYVTGYPDELLTALLRKFLAGESESSVKDWINTLCTNESYMGAYAVMQEAKSLGILYDSTDVSMMECSILYLLGKYDAVIDLYRKTYSVSSASSEMAGIDLIYALSCFQVHDIPATRQVIYKYSSKLGEEPFIQSYIMSRLNKRGVRDYLMKLAEFIDGAELEGWEYDPFVRPPLV